ncbi:16541_t:CDS:1 [Funneliformis mosseae]|uniref:Phosphatidylglycerol/phosphatidylinositol transfer protein n=1 Tax=Funneliformis mosseae TaxID=27381 RepID=A0A9N9I504_FUNMO|nr:16541_t:CDS:1 [Funneliformis mosseae]
MVNAIPHKLIKRTTTFKQCPPPEGSTTPPPLLQVSLSADPPVAKQKNTFTVSGKLSRDVAENTRIVISFVDLNKNTVIFDDFVCTDVRCPIKAGDQFTKTMTVEVPGNLTSSYVLTVGVGYTSEPIGCAFATI